MGSLDPSEDPKLDRNPFTKGATFLILGVVALLVIGMTVAFFTSSNTTKPNTNVSGVIIKPTQPST